LPFVPRLVLVFFLVFLNFHFFAKVWSLKLLAKIFARDVNALAKVLRISSGTWTLYGLIVVMQMRWQTENTLGQIESSRTYYSINRNI
jgi:hypothetical protein